MWVPADSKEIQRAARDGELHETATFDAKADLPAPKRNIDLAVDVAAMSTDGGMLLYGVGEDGDGNLTLPNPIELAGVAERIDQIVSNSISEVPRIETRVLALEDDSSRGYVVVVVPQSPRAPHQVTVGGDLRFYARGAKGNRRLTEGDVARLYERRQSWAVDREVILAEAVQHAPVPPMENHGYLHAYARPVALDQGMLETAMETIGREQMHQHLLGVVHETRLSGTYAPSLTRASYWRRQGADAWRLSSLGDEQRTGLDDPTGLAELSLNIDGRGHLFCGRATDVSPEGPRVLIEVVIAGNLEAFFAIMGSIYRAAAYHGAVDVGVALTGLRGAHSAVLRGQHFFDDGVGYDAEAFTRTARVSPGELEVAPDLVQRLLRHFFEASAFEGYNPFQAEVRS